MLVKVNLDRRKMGAQISPDARSASCFCLCLLEVRFLLVSSPKLCKHSDVS